MHCPCGSNNPFDTCCAPVINGDIEATSAEQLMRARYTAYTREEIDFIMKSTSPTQNNSMSPEEIRRWAKKTDWRKLEILRTERGGEEDDSGMVEFIAHHYASGAMLKHHEIAEFSKIDGSWYFQDATTVPQEQLRRDTPKVGRNDPCPCGSGKKFKKCCG